MTCTQNVHILRIMRYLWDPEKQRKNLKKHSIEFADAAIALEDENALTILDKDSEGEYRFQTLCFGLVLDVLLVVHTEEHGGLSRLLAPDWLSHQKGNNILKG